jgi:CRISPR system Cascade subunit CasE
MTTFTKILINPQRRQARKLLTNPQAMHAAVRAAFPPDLSSDSRILWRLDSREHEHALYVVAPEAPDASNIIEQASWATRPQQTADYAPLLGSLVAGQEWAFELVANPTKSLPQGIGKRGRVVAHVTPKQQIEWLMERSQSAGFDVVDATVIGRENLSFYKGDDSKRRVTIRTARFRGVLRVTDPDLLRRTLVDGIGRGRAYGCGLLTLAKA